MSPAKPARLPHGGAQDGRAASSTPITDFELVRNADGAWLLIVPELPERLLDNPLAEIRAELCDDDTLLLFSHTASAEIHNLLAQEYATALRMDTPKDLLVCTVDQDGMRRDSQRVPFTIA